MSEKFWTEYLNKIQISYLPLTLRCIGVLLALSAFRDVVFAGFEPPIWLNLLNGLVLGLIAIIGIAASVKKVKARYSNLLLFLCAIVMCLKPAVVVYLDNSPGSLILATVIFAFG